MSHVRLIETFHIPFYLPHYLAMAMGAFAREGLEIQTRTAGGGTGLLQALAEGTTQVALGGPIRAMHEAARGRARIFCFADVNRRDGFLLLARHPAPDFRLEGLRGARIILFDAAPTPNLLLRHALAAAAVDPGEVRWIERLPEAEGLATLRRGEADYLVAFQPAAEAVLGAGEAHLALPLSRLYGDVAYTAYMTTAVFSEEHPDVLIGMAAALGRAQAWLHTRSPAETAAAVRPLLPDVAEDLLEAVVKRYLGLGVWAETPHPLAARYSTLEDILVGTGYLPPGKPLPPVWEGRYAEAAMARKG